MRSSLALYDILSLFLELEADLELRMPAVVMHDNIAICISDYR
jgi:hypothetical protein